MDLLLDTIKIFLGARWLVVSGWPANGGEKDILSLGVSGKKGVKVVDARRSSKKILKYPI